MPLWPPCPLPAGSSSSHKYPQTCSCLLARHPKPKRERERVRESETESERVTERESDRERGRERERESEREWDRETDTTWERERRYQRHTQETEIRNNKTRHYKTRRDMIWHCIRVSNWEDCDPVGFDDSIAERFREKEAVSSEIMYCDFRNGRCKSRMLLPTMKWHVNRCGSLPEDTVITGMLRSRPSLACQR